MNVSRFTTLWDLALRTIDLTVDSIDVGEDRRHCRQNELGDMPEKDEEARYECKL